jgi:hypothetical protein
MSYLDDDLWQARHSSEAVLHASNPKPREAILLRYDKYSARIGPVENEPGLTKMPKLFRHDLVLPVRIIKPVPNKRTS